MFSKGNGLLCFFSLGVRVPMSVSEVVRVVPGILRRVPVPLRVLWYSCCRDAWVGAEDLAELLRWWRWLRAACTDSLSLDAFVGLLQLIPGEQSRQNVLLWHHHGATSYPEGSTAGFLNARSGCIHFGRCDYQRRAQAMDCYAPYSVCTRCTRGMKRVYHKSYTACYIEPVFAERLCVYADYLRRLTCHLTKMDFRLDWSEMVPRCLGLGGLLFGACPGCRAWSWYPRQPHRRLCQRCSSRSGTRQALPGKRNVHTHRSLLL